MSDSSKFTKLLISARYWILGIAQLDPEYFKVLEALEFSLDHHDGLRNGGDPEFMHQLSIFHHLRTLHNHLRNPKMVYTLGFLHDAIEDPNQTTKRFITLEEIEQRWGVLTREKVGKLSKEILGQSNPHYNLRTIFEDCDCGPVKLGDRVHNVSSMIGVFKKPRVERYVKETVEEFLPGAKIGRRIFPDQEAVYENMKLELVNQLQLINHILPGY